MHDARYTGKWIYGKTRIKEPGSRKAVPMPKSEWIVVGGAIPAIISEEQFARVKAVLDEVPKNKRPANIERAVFSNLKDASLADVKKLRDTSLADVNKLKAEKMALWEQFHSGCITRDIFKEKNAGLSLQILQHEE